MSSLNLNVFVEPEDADALDKLNQFIALIAASDYEGIEAMDEDDDLYDIDDIFNTTITSSVKKGIVNFAFETSSSMEVETLVAFLKHIGAGTIEISAFSSQVGEYFFMKEDEEYLNDYDEAEWTWLPNPEAKFSGEFVVVTGTIEHHDRSDIEALVSDLGGTVQQSVNSKTTLLVLGSKPGKSKVDKAAALGVRTMEADEFFDVVQG